MKVSFGQSTYLIKTPTAHAAKKIAENLGLQKIPALACENKPELMIQTTKKLKAQDLVDAVKAFLVRMDLNIEGAAKKVTTALKQAQNSKESKKVKLIDLTSI